MIKKIIFFVFSLNLFMCNNSYANSYYGIVNLNLIPSTSSTYSVSGERSTTKNFFKGGSIGLELTGGMNLTENCSLELTLGYINHSNTKYESTYYTSTRKPSSIDAKIGFVYKSEFIYDEIIFQPYISPQFGYSQVNFAWTYSNNYSEPSSSAYSGLLFGIKGGIRIPFAKKYLTDIGIGYTRRYRPKTINDITYEFRRYNSISLNCGVGMNF